MVGVMVDHSILSCVVLHIGSTPMVPFYLVLDVSQVPILDLHHSLPPRNEVESEMHGSRRGFSSSFLVIRLTSSCRAIFLPLTSPHRYDFESLIV